jgi:2-polyprenyl-3-methyl-5-hydroxy-6-metoxy-1,4-benzoquinol methylase
MVMIKFGNSGLPQEFDSHASTYQAAVEKATNLFGQKHSFFVRDKLEKMMDAFKQEGNPANMKVLDIGCGSGRDLAVLARKGFDAYGIDPTSEFVDIAQRIHQQF